MFGLFFKKDEMDKSLFNLIPRLFQYLDGETGGFYNNCLEILMEMDSLDFILPTENYHGEEYQPDYYIPGCYLTYDKLFLNNGNGFSKIVI